MTQSKHCTACNTSKPLGDFYAEARNKVDGRSWACKVCLRIYNAKNYVANRERLKEKSLRYAKANPEKVKLASHKYYLKRRDTDLYRAIRATWAREHNRVLRKELLVAYGHKCACCGISAAAFLTLEHKFRDGAEHRKRTKAGPSMNMELKRLGWPTDRYTLLCMNCNFATRYGDVCPHKI